MNAINLVVRVGESLLAVGVTIAAVGVFQYALVLA